MKSKLEDKPDIVVAPSHYRKGKYEALDMIDSILSVKDVSPQVAFPLGQVLRYIIRSGEKAPDQSKNQTKEEKMIEDLEKAEFYLEYAIQRLKGTDSKEILDNFRK